MSTNTFLIWSRESTVPLTVLARNATDAEITYCFWCSIHQPLWSTPPAKIVEVSPEWLAQHPKLDQLVERAREQGIPDAVVLFNDAEGSWFAFEVHEDPRGAIAPPDPAVRAFTAKTKLDDVMIFAKDANDALAMYLIYTEEFFGAAAHPDAIEEFSRWTLAGDMEVLRKQMEMGVTGIAGWSPTRGWSIYPPDHEMAGE